MILATYQAANAAAYDHTYTLFSDEVPNTRHSLVIIDAGIDHHQLLAQGILPTAEVIILNQDQDGITQISGVLSKHPVASLQLIAHGSPGSLQLGNSQLNLENLHTYRQQLQQWPISEILIYGCEVALLPRGEAFIQELHTITGANIAASTKKIGHSQHGGTWELEVNIGKISSTLALKPEVKAAYPGVLANFATAANFTVGTNPRSVTVADFNGDGKQDIVAANFGNESNSVSLLLGNGTGGFATATNFTVGDGPISVAVGDFNGDTKLDLAVANLDSKSVSLLLGDGIGSFGTATNVPVATRPYSVVAKDFNGDNKLDLAVANTDDNNVSILLGNGTGGFGTATNFTVGTNPNSVVAVDFNGDGKLDLATANNASNNVSILLGDGTGGFGTATNFTVGTNPNSVVAGDFNGDGKLDLATANNSSNNVSILLGDGTGGFGAATNFTVGNSPNAIVTGDFNGDGKLDLATPNESDKNVSVLLGNGTGGFVTATNFTVGSRLFALTTGDFNGDNKRDLATANFDTNNVSVLLNTTSLTNAPTELALSATSVNENVAAGTVIGTFTSTDPDPTNTFTYSLVTGTGATDNSAFTITDNQLKINASPNFEAKPSYDITVRTTDNTGLFFDKALKVTVNDVNEAPTDVALSATSVNNKVAAGTVIGTFTSTDEDKDDTFTYALFAGVDGVDNSAFTIDGNSLKIQNSPDLQTQASYKINVRTTDKGGLTFDKAVTINVKNSSGDDPGTNPNNIPNRLTNIGDDVFNIKSDTAKAQLQVTLAGSSSNQLRELALFTVDDAKGTINGIAPGATGYAQAALERSRVIFSAIANPPNGFDTKNLSSLLELNSGDNLRIVSLKNSSFDAVRAGITPITELKFTNPATEKITNLGDNNFSIKFDDLEVTIKQTNQALPLGTNLQSKSQGELIDLRSVNQQVKADFTVYREASFNNFVGFYQVADENGGIDTNGDGKADLLTGQAGYTQAAIRGRVAGIDLTVNNQGTATYTGTFKPGAIFAPFIIIDGKPDAILDTNPNNDPAVYFPYLGANTDKTDHIRLLGSNTFGFEDLPNGGDQDFNDLIVKVNLTPTV